ncbi:MAG: hypothetical protein DDT39_00021 [Firmicutes bacterium]|nr:hypothetical protein [candidate division NPL-UPA2 bacterium]
MTAAYDAFVDFKTKLDNAKALFLYTDRSAIYRVKCAQILAEYAWLQKIINNRLSAAYKLEHYYSWDAYGEIINTIEAIRPLASVASEQFKCDLAQMKGRVYAGLVPMLAAHFECATNSLTDVNAALESFEYGVPMPHPATLNARDDLVVCERSDHLYRECDITEVVVRLTDRGRAISTEMWGCDSLDDYAFYCDASGHHYAHSVFRPSDVYNGNEVCEEYMIARIDHHGYAWSERRDQWVRDSDWEYGHHDWDDDESESESEDDDSAERSEYMYDYHKAPKHLFAPRIKLACQSLRGFFGYELEMLFDDFDTREQFMRDVRNENIGPEIIAFERDGSLQNDEAGVEVIIAPLSLKEVQDSNGVLATVLGLAEDYNAYISPRCGTHVTINTHRLTPHHKAQFVAAFYELQALSVFVAKREHEAYASFKTALEKYSAVHMRTTNVYEFRAFAGTVSHCEAASYAEYIEAIAEWTADPGLPLFAYNRRAAPDLRSAFRMFTRTRSDKYPNLARRFCAPALLHKEVAQCA